MILNLNIGILGHVDCGKTTLAKALSQIPSTAAFDKSPQSQERGITLDLGFSAHQCPLPEHLLSSTISSCSNKYTALQLTFVDCPGHAKLIRTIIGGAQIIDIMLLVIDITKGIQTQTAECMVLGEICAKPMLIALSKVDKIEVTKRQRTIEKIAQKLSKTLGVATNKIVAVSATLNENLDELLRALCRHANVPVVEGPPSAVDVPFLFAVDHCFSIRGKGTICTGTVLQGRISCNDTVEISSTNCRSEMRKVKSIQMFRQPMMAAEKGDRAGLCITQFDADTMERGLIATPAFVKNVSMAIVNVKPIKYFKDSIASGAKYHIHIGHETVMAKITLFLAATTDGDFDWHNEYEYLPELAVDATDRNAVFALLQFERIVMTVPDSLVIASKLDADVNANNCRLVFWGHLLYGSFDLTDLRVFKRKSKQGIVQRVISETEIIVDRMFKKESNRQLYVGLRVSLSSGESGIIQSTFGSTSKMKVQILGTGLAAETMEKLRDGCSKNDITVVLTFKKYLYDENNLKLKKVQQ